MLHTKIEIQDISISSILEQYLAWLDERKRMDMEVASEFIEAWMAICIREKPLCLPVLPPAAMRPSNCGTGMKPVSAEWAV